MLFAAGDHVYKDILTSLPKPDGGDFGKYFSLPALNDPRVGKFFVFHKLFAQYVWGIAEMLVLAVGN